MKMAKRVLFVSIVTLTVASISSAGILDFLFPQTSVSQQQSFCGNLGQSTVKAGPGTAYSSGTMAGNLSQKATSSGTCLQQNANVYVKQTSAISGGCGSYGASYQNASVNVSQTQSTGGQNGGPGYHR
jgi:hypothetical protein